MNNYHAYEPGWFKTSAEELTKLKKYKTFNVDTYEADLSKIKNYFHTSFKFEEEVLDVIGYEIRKTPHKKHKHDHAVLLCVRLKNGDNLAKRHNNSQWLSLDYQ